MTIYLFNPVLTQVISREHDNLFQALMQKRKKNLSIFQEKMGPVSFFKAVQHVT